MIAPVRRPGRLTWMNTSRTLCVSRATRHCFQRPHDFVDLGQFAAQAAAGMEPHEILRPETCACG